MSKASDSFQQHLLLSGVTSGAHTQWENMDSEYYDTDNGQYDDLIDSSDTEYHKKNTLVSSIVTFVCTTVGAGTLALPSSIGESGWLGLIIIAIVASACTLTAQYLIACMFSGAVDENGNRLRIQTFEDIGTAAFGKPGRYIVALLQTITLYGACAIFLILIGSNMAELTGVNIHIWVIVAGAVLVPISWLKTMKEISVLAYFGLTASLTVGVVVIVEGIRRAHNAGSEDVTIDHQIINGSGISPAINIIVFSFGGHSVIPAIVTEMKQPQKNYKRFAAFSFGFIAMVYAAVAGLGYLGYGLETIADADSGNILSTMERVTPHGHSTVVIQIARVFITAHVALAYPLPLNPVCLLVEEVLGIDKMEGRKELTYRIALRSSLVIGSVILALVVPYFGDILQLVSALSMIAIAFILPPLFYWRLYHHKIQIPLRHRIFMVCSIVLGFAASGIGLYYAGKALANDVSKGGNPFACFFC